MKRINYILVIFTLAIISVGCEKQTVVNEEIIIPTDGYITFNIEVASRGTLINDMKRDFSVTAFNYDKGVNWSTVVATIQPNVFYKQSVVWSNGIHSYNATGNIANTQLVPWDETKKYTFFAHYPTSLTISGNAIYGTPYITYTLPTTVDDMKDIMTASVFDTDNTLTNSVGLTFKHRLTALDVQIRNLNKKAIELDKLNIAFSNLKYGNVTIPLDESLDMTRTGTPTQEYAVINSNTSIPAESIVNLEKHLILIPQEGNAGTDFLKGVLKFSYSDKDTDEADVAFDVGRDMRAGRKYFLQMTFSAGAITIAIIESGEWEDKDVDIEFE